jgi:GT2 family glycosyltransferase
LMWLNENPDYIAISGGFATLFPDGIHAADLACEGAGREVTDLLRSGQALTSLCTWLVRADAVARAGGARPWFVTAEDVDLQFRLAEVGRVWHEPRVAYLYRLHEKSITHRTDSVLVDFYHEQAQSFARERRANGEDALQRGCPPSIPAARTIRQFRHSAHQQATGHAISAAWREFANEDGSSRYRRLWLFVAKRPYSLRLWRHIALLSFAALKRKIL